MAKRDISQSEVIFLLGKSGSGKSTLLNAIGGLDTFDSGEIIIYSEIFIPCAARARATETITA